MRKIALLISILACAMVLFTQSSQSVADPWVGVWKLDTSQSQFHRPAPQEETVQVEAASQGTIRYTASGTDADGKPFLESYDGKSDGQSYPIAINGFEGGKISYQQVSDREYTGQGTMTDGTTVTNTITLSPDGKTITIKSHGADSKGAYDETVVLVKQ